MPPPRKLALQDVSEFPRVLKIIRNHQGTVVSDLFLRSGRRELRSDEKGLLSGKKRARSRKGTLQMPVLHPDCNAAPAILTEGAMVEVFEEVAREEDADGDRDEDDAGMAPAAEVEIEVGV
jgi:hypothetical protein